MEILQIYCQLNVTEFNLEQELEELEQKWMHIILGGRVWHCDNLIVRRLY